MANSFSRSNGLGDKIKELHPVSAAILRFAKETV